MRVDIAAEAEHDLTEIARYIAQDSLRKAVEFVNELRSACEGLSDFAERFPLVPRYEQLEIRRRVCGNYLIFYRVESERVVVIHVLHGAKDYSDLFD
jgi:plasmid stabilization system protein ParE